MVLRVNYYPSGLIDSFQEGGEDTDNLCPEGCATLKFAGATPAMFNVNGGLAVKVDPVGKALVLLNPLTLPGAID